MILLAIDPGHTQSALLCYDTADPRNPVAWASIMPNEEALKLVSDRTDGEYKRHVDYLLIEQVASYGMPVGAEVFETVFWSGRFAQAWGKRVERMTRQQIKMALCHHIAKVNDAVIRQRLIDIFGGKDKAIGGVKCQGCKGKGWRGAGRPTCVRCEGNGWWHPPGPLYGVTKDEWAALALAVAWSTVNGLRSATA